MQNNSKLADTLSDSFIAIPTSESKLSTQQLQAIFGGDLSVLQELAQLALYSNDAPE